MKEKIGNVELNYKYYTGYDLYSDGDIENILLEFVRSGRDLEDIVAHDYRWPVLYHLSPVRQNIINVMNIDKNDLLLEVGSGCGAMTEGFVSRAGKVFCVDLSKKRSIINAERNRASDNLEIIVGNFNEIVFAEKFDVITLIGVLEYAESYIPSGEKAYHEFLCKIGDLLKPDGRVYTAIENKYGLKYFAGSREDHTGRLFDGIADYTGVEGIRTFSKSELEKMLLNSGFKDLYFYYPMPDYKFAQQIFSDAQLPQKGELRNLAVAYDRDRDVLFSEEAAYDGLIRAGYFDIFANSFLIEAVKD